MEGSPLLRGRSWNSIESLIMTVDLYQCIHIDTTPMTLNGIMTLCKHRLGPTTVILQVAIYGFSTLCEVVNWILEQRRDWIQQEGRSWNSGSECSLVYFSFCSSFFFFVFQPTLHQCQCLCSLYLPKEYDNNDDRWQYLQFIKEAKRNFVIL